MPTAPLRPCAVPLCPTLVTHGRCPAHALPLARAKALFTSRLRQTKRGTAHQRGYTKRQHAPWAKSVKQKHPLCVGYPWGFHGGFLVQSVAADHIVPLAEWDRAPERAAEALQAILAARGEIADLLHPWSLDNGQGLCLLCHGRKSRDEGQGPRAA
jgi:hypothetical protein